LRKNFPAIVVLTNNIFKTYLDQLTDLLLVLGQSGFFEANARAFKIEKMNGLYPLAENENSQVV